MITIKRLRIKENAANEVTSEKVFTPRKIRDKEGKLCFHPDGIFSERIFGKFNKCNCGQLTHAGVCKNCGVRVLNKRRMPNFYISFDGLLDIPYADIKQDFANNHEVLCLFNYKGFLYDGTYHNFDPRKDDLTKYDQSKVLIGKDALLYLGATEEWYEQQIYTKLSIPHTSLRKITIQNNKYFLGTMNTIFIDVLKKKKLLESYASLNTNDVFYLLNLKKYILEKINEIYDELFEMLAKTKKSVIAREIRGQGLTGIIRAVITNNFSVDEDKVIIGKYFIKTLYPRLAAHFTLDDGTIDIKALNEYLIENEYYVLLNRQPTIGAKSILGMIPVFSDKDAEKYVLQLNPIIFDGLAGDCDGDVLSVTALYSRDACQEAKQLLPSVNYIEGSNSTVRNKCPEDFIYTMQKMYDNKTPKAQAIHELINAQ